MSGFSVEQMGRVGSVNAVHGVCGFTSTLTAIYAQQPGRRGLLQNGAPRVTRVLAEIKTYLRMLQAANEAALLHEIDAFNATMYPQMGNPTGSTGRPWPGMVAFIGSIDGCVALLGANTTMTQDNDLLNQLKPPFVLYMSPNAVADYVQRMWGMTAVVAQTATLPPGNCIIGVTRPGPVNPHLNLVHWMYKHGTDIWSWGNQYDAVTDANPAYTVIYTITIT